MRLTQGIDLVQVRERDLDTADLAASLSTIIAMAPRNTHPHPGQRSCRRRAGVRRRRVHLRTDSVPAAAVRSIAPLSS
jgi:thiamine monophosphate synthase